MREAAESAETDDFDPQIAAATGAAAGTKLLSPFNLYDDSTILHRRSFSW